MYTFNYLKSFLRTNSLKIVYHNIRRSITSNRGNNDQSLFMYTTEQQLFIIDTLHKCALNNTPRVHLNEKRLQSIRLLFEQNPDLRSLEPLLNINGIGPKLLHRICDSILQQAIDRGQQKDDESTDDDNNGDIGPNKLRSISSLITPSHLLQCKVERVVAIHLGINAISWARLQTVGTAEMDTWDIMDMSQWLEKKFNVHNIWDLSMLLRNKIPDGDIFVMENNNWSSVANIKKPMKYHIQEAMLTTAICSVFNQRDCEGQPSPLLDNRLYFLRAFTPSRLFSKLVGSERVSAQDIVQDMINGVPDQRYRQITFKDDTAELYLGLNGPLRDNMCRALLLVVSFAELILHQNPAALSAIGKPLTAKRKVVN